MSEPLINSLYEYLIILEEEDRQKKIKEIHKKKKKKKLLDKGEKSKGKGKDLTRPLSKKNSAKNLVEED